MHETEHRRIRAVARYYPFTNGAVVFSRFIGRWCEGAEPLWLAAGRFRSYPNLVLNVSSLPQRKVFYFPRAYGDLYLKKPLAALLRARLRPGGVFVDIGANLGAYTWLAAQLVGASGNVFAFEPDPETFESLRRTVEANALTQVRPFNLALSNRAGDLRFFRARDGFASSLIPEAPGREGRYAEEISVRVAALDDVSEVAPARVDLVKVDVEGEEARTVAGMRQFLERTSRPPLWIEVRGPLGSTRAPGTFAEVCRVLEPLGYRPYRWRRHEAQPISPGSVRKREDVLFQAG